METIDFHHGERVRDTRDGSTGRVHIWEPDPREPDQAIGEVRWDRFGADELELAAPYLVRHTDEHTNTDDLRE